VHQIEDAAARTVHWPSALCILMKE